MCFSHFVSKLVKQWDSPVHFLCVFLVCVLLVAGGFSPLSTSFNFLLLLLCILGYPDEVLVEKKLCLDLESAFNEVTGEVYLNPWYKKKKKITVLIVVSEA